VDEWETRSIDSDLCSTIEVIPRDSPSEDIQKDSSPDQPQDGLLTPETTPAPQDPSLQGPLRGPALPRQRITRDVDESNIVEGTRARKPSKKRQEAYYADLGHPEELPANHSAFASGVKEGKPRIHQVDLPPPPRPWKELQRHRYAKEFKEAADKEYQSLNDRGTFKIVRKTPDIKVIPLTWVFTCKLDTDGYLIKFKARICVRGDLQ
jgi:hypothetical protein